MIYTWFVFFVSLAKGGKEMGRKMGLAKRAQQEFFTGIVNDIANSKTGVAIRRLNPNGKLTVEDIKTWAATHKLNVLERTNGDLYIAKAQAV